MIRPLWAPVGDCCMLPSKVFLYCNSLRLMNHKLLVDKNQVFLDLPKVVTKIVPLLDLKDSKTRILASQAYSRNEIAIIW